MACHVGGRQCKNTKKPKEKVGERKMLKLEEDYITEKNHILKATGRIHRRQLEIVQLASVNYLPNYIV